MDKKVNYKGFDKDLKCRGFQYEIGQEYESKKAKACECGFHACEYPLDVFDYYAPSESRYCEVEQGGDIDNSESDKTCSTKIKINAEIGIAGIVKAAVEYIKERVKWKDSAATNTGHCSAATNTGDCSAATNTGDRSAATNTGYCSAATNTGDRSAATNTGDRSAATNTGYCSAATNTGHCSAATNTGDRSASEVSGKDSVAIVTGKDSKARGTTGNWIVLTERGKWNSETYPIKDVQAFKVDGEIIKEMVWYKLVDGKPVECE